MAEVTERGSGVELRTNDFPPFIETVKSVDIELLNLRIIVSIVIAFLKNIMLLQSLYRTFTARNTFYDSWFYDITKLSLTEREKILSDVSQEGKLIVVPPGDSSQKIRYYQSTEDFLASERDSIQALVVAGVGSSTLGTAALARNVANTYQIDVAGIVTGYGATDIVTEALGGWFFYGALDQWQQQIRANVESVEALADRAQVTSISRKRYSRFSDVNALNAILNDIPPNLSLLLGHSKGDLLIDYSLEKFAKLNESNHHQYFEDLNIVTVGTVTDLPPQFQRTHQFIGQVDWFGGINSRLSVDHETVPHAWHHLNTKLPFHLDLEKTLRENVLIT